MSCYQAQYILNLTPLSSYRPTTNTAIHILLYRPFPFHILRHMHTTFPPHTSPFNFPNSHRVAHKQARTRSHSLINTSASFWLITVLSKHVAWLVSVGLFTVGEILRCLTSNTPSPQPSLYIGESHDHKLVYEISHGHLQLLSEMYCSLVQSRQP